MVPRELHVHVLIIEFCQQRQYREIRMVFNSEPRFPDVEMRDLGSFLLYIPTKRCISVRVFPQRSDEATL